MEKKTVIVAGATGYLGLKIVRALLSTGASVRALVRPTSDRTKLESLGVSDFAVGDMLDPESLKAGLARGGPADALIASAAGYTGHTKGDSRETDTQGYRNLVDACMEAKIPRFVLVSILECDKAVSVPHFHDKYLVEEYLRGKGQPYIALRAGAFLDQARDMVLPRVKAGVYPAFFPRAEFGMVYTPDLARYAAMAATVLPESALNRSVDIGWESPASGPELARAFSQVLGIPVVPKPAFPAAARLLMPLMSLFSEGLRDMGAMLKWVGTGAYVSKNPRLQKELFGELPTLSEAVQSYCLDKSLVNGPETS